MNAVCSLFNDLTDYILKRLEVSLDSTFRQSELEEISSVDFQWLKKSGYLVFEYRDIEKTSFIDSDGIRRFVRRIKEQYWGYSQNPEYPGRILLAPEELKHFKFNLTEFIDHVRQTNNLLGKPDQISKRILYVGEKHSDQRTGVFLGFFADDNQAESELLSLRLKVSFIDQLLVLCPSYECTQDLLRKLNHQGIDCWNFDQSFDSNGTIKDIDLLKTTDTRFKKGQLSISLPGLLSDNQSNLVIIGNQQIELTDAIFVVFLHLIIGAKKNKDGWVEVKKLVISKDETLARKAIGRLRKELHKSLKKLGSDKMKFIKTGRGCYRLAVKPNLITYDKESIMRVNPTTQHDLVLNTVKLLP